jgi:hypothetical protein
VAVRLPLAAARTEKIRISPDTQQSTKESTQLCIASASSTRAAPQWKAVEFCAAGICDTVTGF